MSHERSLRIDSVIAILAIALLWSACSKSTSPDNTTPQSKVTISGPKTGFVNELDTFQAVLNFTSSSRLLFDWLFDSLVVKTNATTQTWTFRTPGLHHLSVRVIDQNDSKILCSATDSFFSLVDTAKTFSAFQQVRISFVGQHIFDPENGCSFYSSHTLLSDVCNISWKGLDFSGQNIMGSLTSDISQILMLRDSETRVGGYTEYGHDPQGNLQHRDHFWTAYGMWVINNLPMVFFNSDSAVYESKGRDIPSHNVLSISEKFYNYDSYTGKSDSSSAGAYSGTNFSGNPLAILRVTFYK
jgi:hypothetical protein